MIIDKRKYPDVFVHNDDLNENDRILFESIKEKHLSASEYTFLKRMKEKEEDEFAPSADILINEHSNGDEIYLIRYYYSEYKIGRGMPGHRCAKSIYNDSLWATLNADMFPLLGKHIAFREWLRLDEFKSVNYNGNYVFHLDNSSK